MPDEVPMVTSCPLCLAADEVSSMITIEINRAIGGGRTAIMMCRSCAGAVIRAARHAEPALLDLILTERDAAAISAAASETEAAWKRSVGATEVDQTQAESAELHDGEEPDDGKTTVSRRD